MKIKYTAEFVNNSTVNVYFDKKMLDKVENLYFYVIQDNKIIEQTTSNKQTLADSGVCFEVILKEPIDLKSNYNILVCKNEMVKINSPKGNQ